MSDQWPKGWTKVTCMCGALIGGYNSADPPQLLEIQHKCNPAKSTWVTTVLQPTGGKSLRGYTA